MLALLLAAALGWAAPSAGPKTHVVVIENMKFSPAVLHVQPGDTVEFRNADLVPHNVSGRAPADFDSGLIDRGGSWRFVAEHTAAFAYRCIYHPDMTGTIIVGNAPSPAVATRRGGPAELCGVP